MVEPYRMEDWLAEVDVTTSVMDDTVSSRSVFRIAGTSEEAAVEGLTKGLKRIAAVDSVDVTEVWQDHDTDVK